MKANGSLKTESDDKGGILPGMSQFLGMVGCSAILLALSLLILSVGFVFWLNL